MVSQSAGLRPLGGMRLLLMMLVLCLLGGCASSSSSQRPGKTVYILAVGNSFSRNATSFLPMLANAGGHELKLARAETGGCSLERHLKAAQLFETSPDEPEARLYKVSQPDGTTRAMSLKELLLSEPWQYVTLQQASGRSCDYSTYQPYASELAGYIRRYAPHATLVAHETWAYRQDDQIYAAGLTPAVMYQEIQANYARMADEIGAAWIIPSGRAIHMATLDPRWKLEIEDNLVGLWYPHLPRQTNSLYTGYCWDKNKTPPRFWLDAHHLSPFGRYLAAAVWYETFFGDVRQIRAIPSNFTAREAASLREIAHAAVAAQRSEHAARAGRGD